MSFMFNPHPYDDPTAVNRLDVTLEHAERIFRGTESAAEELLAASLKILKSKGKCTVCLDGYPGAQFRPFVEAFVLQARKAGQSVTEYDAAQLAKTPEELEAILKPYFPTDRSIDPVLLYGKLFEGGYGDLFDEKKAEALARRLRDFAGGILLVSGHGAACESFRTSCDLCVWMDVTPKKAVLLAKEGKVVNLGDRSPRPFKELMRRAYYCDFYLSEELRGRLLRSDGIDYYLCADRPEDLVMLTGKALSKIMDSLSDRPFRCKPVYIEGVWGGQFIKKLRRLPDEVKNVAWCFDMIPLEVSIVARVNGCDVEFPYHAFVQKKGEAIMGAEAVQRFHGYFPVRFNYDDTWHSNGNMSIQVHPDEKYVRDNFNDFGRQDESYYIVATGHGAKTYCGLKENADLPEFFSKVRQSETEKEPIPYDDYVNSIPSVPGKQFMLPSGTIHSSGRNQLILEIGSLTIGSYTFKLYDYLRLDLDGKPRPIHSRHGEKVLNPLYRADYVAENLVHAPVPVRSGEGWREWTVGQCEQLYFTLHRLEFEKKIDDNTGKSFHVLVLVDGERVCVRSKSDPKLCYHMDFLDMVVVPASVGEYEIVNEGDQPVVVHKTYLKD